MLTPLLSPLVCASCRLCCNFVEESRWETPALEPECAARLRSMGVSLVERPEGGETIALCRDAAHPEQAVDCPLLDPACGCTLPRAQRPLECRLWPLRLMRDEAGHPVVAYYAGCPGLQAAPHEELVALAQSLRPLFLRRLAEFPESVRPMHPNYTIVFSLNDSSSRS